MRVILLSLLCLASALAIRQVNLTDQSEVQRSDAASDCAWKVDNRWSVNLLNVSVAGFGDWRVFGYSCEWLLLCSEPIQSYNFNLNQGCVLEDFLGNSLQGHCGGDIAIAIDVVVTGPPNTNANCHWCQTSNPANCLL